MSLNECNAGIFEASSLRHSDDELTTVPMSSKPDEEQNESEESGDSNKGPRSTVSFGGKMKSPFLGKTLPCDDDSDEDDGDEVGYESNSPRTMPPSGSEQFDSQCLSTSQQVANSSVVGSYNGLRVSDDRDHVSTYEAENETEEELKAYEMRRYESNSEGSSNSSEEEDTSDEDSSRSFCKEGEEKLAKFLSGKQARSALGKEVYRPKPIMGGSPTQSVGESTSSNVSSKQEHDNEDESSSESGYSSSGSVETDGGKDISVDSPSSSPNNSTDSHGSVDKSKLSCSSGVDDDASLSIHESDEFTEHSSDDNGVQFEDAVSMSINEQSKSISSPMEMELDGAIGGAKILPVGVDHEAIPRNIRNGTSSPRNSLSFEDVEEIIKGNNSSDEDREPDSELCFSEDDHDVSNKGCLSNEAKEQISKLLSDLLEIKHAGGLAAFRSLCRQEAKNGEFHESGHVRFPDSTSEYFWIDKILATLAPNSKAGEGLVYSSSRPVLSKKIYDMFDKKLSSIDISHIDVPFSGIQSENTHKQDPAVSQVNEGEEQGLFVGSLKAADCGLALAAFCISHVIRIQCAAPDNLDVIDGVKHSVHILRCGYSEPSSASETVKNAADDISHALQIHNGRVLVACATGDKYACAACVLFFMHHLGMGKIDALEKISEARPSSTVEPGWLEIPPAKDGISKRILSSQMLPSLAGAKTFAESPKRQRLKDNVSSANKRGGTKPAVPLMPTLNLGPPAPSSRRWSIEHADEPVFDESFECERFLSEELNVNCTQKCHSSTPVPLLMPPSSPLVVRSEEGETTVCEWPSNLAVDTAMANTMSLSSPSPSLCSRQEGNRNAVCPAEYLNTPINQPLRPLPSGLTPKLKGIQVSRQ